MEQGSGLAQNRQRRPRRDLALPLCLDEERPRPTDPGGAYEPPTLWFWKTGSSVTRVAQPNESRLSCGATLKYSQMEFYHTARQTFSGSSGDGRRQLQALVRLRATSHSSGPALPRSSRSTHRRWPATGTVMPSGQMLGTHQPHRLPHATGLSLDRAFGWNEPPRRMPASTAEPTTWVVTRELVCGEMRSLTNRA